MSEQIRARVLLAKMVGDTEPSIVAAIDETLWEHWTDADEADWVEAGKKTWGIDCDTVFKVVVASFDPQDLVDAFASPVVQGRVVA